MASSFSPPPELRYVQYHSSKETTYLSAIRQLISQDLSEPYSIYVYRYFLYQWGGSMLYGIYHDLINDLPVLIGIRQ